MSGLHDVIEKAIKDHCEGGDLWLCAHIASEPFDAQLEQLRTDLAAAVAERDEARSAYVAWTTEWHQVELTTLGLVEKFRIRAEQAEARLAAIEAEPVVASVGHGDYLHRHTANVPAGTLLIARPAKDVQA